MTPKLCRTARPRKFKKKTEGTQMSGRNLQVTELLLQSENWTCMQSMPGEQPLLSTNNGLCVCEYADKEQTCGKNVRHAQS